MPYYFGTAETGTALVNAITAACVANGWTLTGDILNKGAAYVQATATNQQWVSGTKFYSGWMVDLLGGTGMSAGALTGAMPYRVRIGGLNNHTYNVVLRPMTYPVAYEIHVFTDPDEVYVVVNHDGDLYTHLMFGISDMAAQVGGTGLWLHGLFNSGIFWGYSFYCSPNGLNASRYGNNQESGFAGGLFTTATPFASAQTPAYIYVNAFLHHAVNGTPGWTTNQDQPRALAAHSPMMARSPSLSNRNAPLFPVQAYLGRPDNMVSLVLDLKNIRYMRNDDYAAGQVFSIGPDVWKSYPWLHKNITTRDGGNGAGNTHSGTLAYAIRYDGP